MTERLTADLEKRILVMRIQTLTTDLTELRNRYYFLEAENQALREENDRLYTILYCYPEE